MPKVHSLVKDRAFVCFVATCDVLWTIKESNLYLAFPLRESVKLHPKRSAIPVNLETQPWQLLMATQ